MKFKEDIYILILSNFEDLEFKAFDTLENVKKWINDLGLDEDELIITDEQLETFFKESEMDDGITYYALARYEKGELKNVYNVQGL
jgi:hypothetical protein